MDPPAARSSTSPGVPDSGHKDQALRRARRAARATSIHVFQLRARPAGPRSTASDPGAAAVRRAGAAELPADERRPEGRLARPPRRLARRQAPARAAQPRRRRRDRGRRLQAGALRQDRQLPLRRGDPARRQDRAGVQRDAGHRVGRRPRRRHEGQGHPGRLAPVPPRGDRRRPARRPRVRGGGQLRPGRGDRHQEARGRAHAVGRPGRRATARRPSTSSVTPDGAYLLVAEAGADELAVFKLPAPRAGASGARSPSERRAQSVLAHEARAAAARDPVAGRTEAEEDHELEAGVARAAPVPADYALVGTHPGRLLSGRRRSVPAGRQCLHSQRQAQAREEEAVVRRSARAPRCSKLVWVSGKGLGVGPNPKGPNPYVINDDNAIDAELPAAARHRQGRRARLPVGGPHPRG